VRHALRAATWFLGGYTSGGVILVASQTPKDRSASALGKLSIGSLSGGLAQAADRRRAARHFWNARLVPDDGRGDLRDLPAHQFRDPRPIIDIAIAMPSEARISISLRP
jgi:hypothetical protein